MHREQVVIEQQRETIYQNLERHQIVFDDQMMSIAVSTDHVHLELKTVLVWNVISRCSRPVARVIFRGSDWGSWEWSLARAG
jgi:hypothetical protein